jgi:hypothetical protein
MVDRKVKVGDVDAAYILGAMFGTGKYFRQGWMGFFFTSIFANIPQQYPQVFHNPCGKNVPLLRSILPSEPGPESFSKNPVIMVGMRRT